MKRSNKVETYSIRKFKTGAFSALIGAAVLGSGIISAPILNGTLGVTGDAYNTIYKEDFSRPGGQRYTEQNGRDGAYRNIIVGYKPSIDMLGPNPAGEVRPYIAPDGEMIRRDIPIYGDVWQPGEDEIIRVGTAPTTETRSVAPRVRYIKDLSRAFGQPNVVETAGENGESTVTTNYTLNTSNGTVTPSEQPAVVTRQPKDKVIKVAAKPTERTFVDDQGRTVTETTDYDLNEDTGVLTPRTPTRIYSADKPSKVDKKTIPSPVIYEKDVTREKGQPNLTTNGTPGEETITTTYKVNPQTGVITPTVGKPVRVKEPTPTKVKVAAKDKVVEREIPNRTRYVKDSEKAFGTSNETQTQGRPGREVTRTVYTVNPTSGAITENTTTTRESEPQDKVVKVGGKSTVRTFKDSDGRTVTETTNYTVAEDTGKVTPTTTRTYGNQKDSTETHKPIPSPVVYEKDATRDKGQPNLTTNGEPGDEVTTTTYSVNPQTGAVTPTVGKPVRVKEPTPTKVKVAAKDKVVERSLPPTVRVVSDDQKDFGSNNTISEGKPGVEVTRTVYNVNPTSGAITEGSTTTTRTSEAGETLVRVGTKPTSVTKTDELGRTYTEITRYKLGPDEGVNTRAIPDGNPTRVYGSEKADTVERKVIPSPVIYEKDDTRDKGQPNLTTNGTPGEETITTTYKVNPQTGAVTPTVGKPVRTKEPTPTKVKVAAKDKVVIKEIPPTVRVVSDDQKDFGSENNIDKGKPGREVTRTVYNVDPKTGTITEGDTTTSRESEPGETIIHVGTKPKVTTGKDENGRSYIETTHYKLGPDNGANTKAIQVGEPTRVYDVDKADTVETKEIMQKVIYEKDGTREKGEPNITELGTPGEETITTSYKVDPKTGEITSTVGDPVRIKDPIPTKVKVAAKDQIIEKEIPSKVRAVRDDEKEPGTPNKVEPGTPGKEITKIVYKVNPNTGEISEDDKSTSVEKEPGETIIHVGTKPKVETKKDDQGRTYTETTTYEIGQDENGNYIAIPSKERKIVYNTEKESTVETRKIPSPIRYEKDESREFGQPNETVKGEDGEETITTTYKVDPQTGEITSTVGKPVRTKEPTTTRVKVAAKSKVDEITEGDKVYQVTTTYEVDPLTGKVTENKSNKKLIKDLSQNKINTISDNKTEPDKSAKTPTVKAALSTGVDAASNLLPIFSLLGMGGGIVLPKLKRKD